MINVPPYFCIEFFKYLDWHWIPKRFFLFSFFFLLNKHYCIKFGRFKEARCGGRKSEETRSRSGIIKVCLEAKYSQPTIQTTSHGLNKCIFLFLFLMNYKEPELPRCPLTWRARVVLYWHWTTPSRIILFIFLARN